MSSPARQPRRRTDDDFDARGRLLDVTVQIAAEGGLRDMTVRRLSERAGLTPRTFYRYFGDARAAFLTASFELHADLRATIEAAYVPDARPAGRALACVDALVGFVQADPVRAEALFVAGPAGGIAIDAVRAETVEWAIGLVMGRGPGPRTTAVHPWDLPFDGSTYRLLAEMAVGGVNAVIWRHLIRGDLAALGAATPYLVETLLRPYEWARHRE
ncbi:MAG: TetR/AcrR family transcriptional regulator [Patulibacter sp.]|nr:TetR/AcrR family transcriptional regulator [Patulibacter sp.]